MMGQRLLLNCDDPFTYIVARGFSGKGGEITGFELQMGSDCDEKWEVSPEELASMLDDSSFSPN